MHTAGFEAAVPTGARPQTHVLVRAATGTGCIVILETTALLVGLEIGMFKDSLLTVRTESKKVNLLKEDSK
jgi:hypothetical protein